MPDVASPGCSPGGGGINYYLKIYENEQVSHKNNKEKNHKRTEKMVYSLYANIQVWQQGIETQYNSERRAYAPGLQRNLQACGPAWIK